VVECQCLILPGNIDAMEYLELLELNRQAAYLLKPGIRVKIVGGKWRGKTGTIVKRDPCFGVHEWLVEIKNAKKKYQVKLYFNAAALIPAEV
jgi:hypothetical protein